MSKQNRTQANSQALYELNPRQELAIDLVLEGKTDGEIAEAVGVTRPTVNLWRNRHPAFIAEMNRRRQSLAAGRLAKLETLTDEVMSATIDLVQQRQPAVVVALAKLLVPGMSSSSVSAGTTDSREVLAQNAARDPIEGLLADMNKARPSDIASAEKELLDELQATEQSQSE
jgi:Homeodomain-like domain